jgi:DNA/RNA-binding domain of Phe-tRNA-synthetase-like protein
VTPSSAHDWLQTAWIDKAIYALRPDYAVILMAVNGLVPGPSDPLSERLLRDAEYDAAGQLDTGHVDDLDHVTQWREAFRAFGAKPQRTRPSVDALLRRAATHQLPRIDRITDTYNAISVLHRLPIGGEDRDTYTGPPRLLRASGDETFDTVHDGHDTNEHPTPGEPVWRDDIGITCRRWNWRQCARTRITAATTNAIFILEGLSALGTEGLTTAAITLHTALLTLSPDAHLSQRLIPGQGMNSRSAVHW